MTDGPVTISYSAANQAYTLSSTTGSITFLPADIDAAQSNAGAVVYVRTNGSTTDTLTLTRPGTSGPITYTYVGSAFWQRTTVTGATGNGAINAVAYGVPTPNAAVPRTGQAIFTVDLIGARTQGGSVSPMSGSGNTIVDFTSGIVATAGRITQGITGAGSFASQARLSSSGNAFSGSFSFDDFGHFEGTINGKLYGPGAEEIGAAFRATSANLLAVGTIMGRRGTGSIGNSQFNDNSSNITQPVLDNSQLFAADGATITTTLTGASGSNVTTGTFSNGSRSSEGPAIFYDSASRSYALIASDRSQTFFPSDFRILTATNTETFGPGGRTVMPTNGQSINLTYARAGGWTFRDGSTNGVTRYRLSNFVYGMPTTDASLPRTGSANFRIIVGGTIADADYPNLMGFNGAGALEANFGTGEIQGLGTLDYREDFSLSGRATATPTGNFNLSAQISGSANRFNGTMNLTGIGNYSGALTGRFFGPAAQELGGSFSISDGGTGLGAGTILGVRDSTAVLPSSVVPLLSLPGPTDLASRYTIFGSSANAGHIVGVNFDPATNSYVLAMAGSPVAGTPSTPLPLNASNRDAGASDASFTAYTGTFQGAPFTAKTSLPGASNPTIALTYTGYATMAYGLPQFRTNYFAVYGVGTPALNMPRTGSATFDGILAGHGSVEVRNAGANGTLDFYNLSGTSRMVADFATASFASTFGINGINTVDQSNRSFGNFSVNGTITGATFSGGINGNSFAGQFFGPNANEFGGIFDFFTTTMPTADQSILTRLQGIAVGGRAP
ncbi:MAG: transferrin-binding protein-like solute binding protein [Proteobacteria bacterium]|nr:transferrin-binding protein-like solute binding protein [Pseudomonadota bacterium]